MVYYAKLNHIFSDMHQSQAVLKNTAWLQFSILSPIAFFGFPHYALILRAHEANHLVRIAFLLPSHPPPGFPSQLSFVANHFLPSVIRVGLY